LEVGHRHAAGITLFSFRKRNQNLINDFTLDVIARNLEKSPRFSAQLARTPGTRLKDSESFDLMIQR